MISVFRPSRRPRLSSKLNSTRRFEVLAEIFAEGIAGDPGRAAAARERTAEWEDREQERGQAALLRQAVLELKQELNSCSTQRSRRERIGKQQRLRKVTLRPSEES